MDTQRDLQNDLAFVIEDDRDIANMYAQVVREAGFQVEVFYDGKAAYERYNSKIFLSPSALL